MYEWREIMSKTMEDAIREHIEYLKSLPNDAARREEIRKRAEKALERMVEKYHMKSDDREERR
jgi:uncharacterized protein (UPF0147 family)